MATGYKTYAIAVLIAVAAGAKYLGYIDQTVFETLLVMLGAGGLATQRAAIAKVDKKLILIPFIALAFSVQSSAQSPMWAVWDYPDAEISEITGFQVKFDSGAYQPIIMPTAETLDDTPVAHKSFRYPVPTSFTSGNHSLAVRACNTTECSWDATAVFKLIGPPKNPRIKR